MIYFNKPIGTRGNFHSHSAKKQKGGVWVVDYISERNSIPQNMRDLPMVVFTMKSSTVGVAQIWLLKTNPTTENTSNGDWEEYRIPQIANDGFSYVGFWNPDNTTEATLQDSGAVGQNGKFYVVVGISVETTVTISGLFESQPTAVNLGDRIESNGVRWIVRPSTVVAWDLIPDKPQSIVDYVNGTVIAHQHSINDIIGLATALADKLSISDVADSGGLYDDVSGEKIITKLFLDTFFYTREDIDILLASGSGGGDGIVTYSIINQGLTIIANKYYGYDNKIWLCLATHTKGASFDYTKFKYQNATTLLSYTWAATGGQTGVTNPIFTIPNASPGEIHVLQQISVNNDEKIFDPNDSNKIWSVTTVDETNDSIQLTLGVGNELSEGDPVSIQYYRDEAQVSNADTLLPEYTWVATLGQTDFVLPSGYAKIKDVLTLLLDTVPAWEVGVDYNIVTTNFTNDTIRLLTGDPVPAGAKLFLKYVSNVRDIVIDTTQKVTYSWANNESSSVVVGSTTTDNIIEIKGALRSVDKTLVTKFTLTIRVTGTPAATLVGKEMTAYVAQFEDIFTGASLNGTDVQLDYNVGALGQGVVFNVHINKY